MNEALHTTLRDAMQLMRTGDLMAATAEIQRRLGGAPHPIPREAADGAAPIEGDFREVDAVATLEGPCEAAAPSSDALADIEPRPAPAARDSVEAPGTKHGFVDGVFACPAGSLSYKLFVPPSYRGQPLPLIVMLHGCTQGPDDFARGTRMNALAEERGCFVVYPAQAQGANASRCWNWFQPEHQGRGAGEPAIIAGLVRELATTYHLDRERLYVAGMSAGGAMAVVLGRTHPELFAAVGVHSGIPYRAAHDMPSAFAAMRGRGAAMSPARTAGHEATAALPVIVFHGDRDMTVNAGNGERVVAAGIATTSPGSAMGPRPPGARYDGTAGGRAYTRTVYKDADAHVVAEHWVLHGAGHAWSGGDARGSFTDAAGPDASREMLRFFLDGQDSAPGV